MAKAISFIEMVQKFNPHHDAKGKFATSKTSSFMTLQTRDPKKQHLADKTIARDKEKSKQAESLVIPKEKHQAAKKPAQKEEGTSVKFEIKGKGTKNLEKAHVTGIKDSNDWQKSLSSKEKDSLAEYKANSSKINRHLRGTEKEKQSAKIKKDVKNIDDAMSKASLKQDTVLHRNVTNDFLDQFSGVKNMKDLIGKKFSDKAYTSTSLMPDNYGSSDMKVKLKINAKKGTKGAYVEDVFRDGSMQWGGKEAEVLLDRNTKFEIVSAKISLGKTYLEVNIL